MKLLRVFLFLALGCLHSALASFHLWDIEEVYSNADGSVQFVRLSSKSDGQGLLTGHALTFTGPGGPRTFTFSTNLASNATANRSLLIGTSTLQSLYGIVPDYVIPSSFFAKGVGANLDFAGADSVSLAALPTDGIKSLNARSGDDNPARISEKGNAEAVNFAGDRFVIGAFGEFGGAYSGVISQEPTVPADSGFLSLKLTPSGTFSGKLNFGVKKYTVAGKFDALGRSTVSLAKGDIVLGLTLDLVNGSDRITVTLTRPTLPVLNCTLDRGVVVPKGGTAAMAGNYTLLLPPSAPSPAPKGYGFALATVSKTGAIKATISLADGTRCSQSVPISKNGVWPLYASLYGAKGLVVGTITFRTVTYLSDLDGDVNWFRPANAKAKTFAQGFANPISLIGSKYVTPPKGTAALQFGPTVGDLKVNIDPVPLLGKAVSYSTSNKVNVTNPGADKLTMSVSAAKGLFTGSFVEVTANKKRKFSGVLFQKQQLAAGFFLNSTEGGTVELAAPPVSTTITSVKSGTVPAGTRLTLTNVLVTGVVADGFFAQIKQGYANFTSADNSGIFVSTDTDGHDLVTAGNRVSLSGIASTFDGTTVIAAAYDVAVLSGGEASPSPVSVTAAELAFGSARAAALESVIVRITGAIVSSVNSAENQFTVDDHSGTEIVGNYFFAPNPLPVQGTAFTGITGILLLRGGVSKIHPRDASDLVLSIPLLSGFGPQPAFVAVGGIGQPTIPNPLTVSLATAVVGDTFISITPSNSAVATVVNGGVTIPSGQTSAPVLVNGLLEGSASLSATLGGTTLNATVQVYSEITSPVLQSLTPANVTISPNKAKDVTITLNHPAPAGGTVILLAANPANLGTLPATVTVPQGQITATFSFTGGAGDGITTITATLGISSQQSTVSIETGLGRLVINEIDYDQFGTDNGEFVEIYNSSASAVDLANISLIFVNGSNNTEYRRVELGAAGSLPSHEYLVVCAAAVVTAPGALRFTPPLATWAATDAIQNGSPDGVLLFDNLSGMPIDSLSYEGSITAAILTGIAGTVSLVEGTALNTAVADSNTANGSLCRLPNGKDTDNANVDWNFSITPTPGAPNTP